MRLTVDFETRSKANLLKLGAYIYAEDPSTSCLMLAVKQDEGPTRVYVPKQFRHLGDTEIECFDLANMLYAATEVHAHNAAFERCLWPVFVRQTGMPEIPLDKWYCTAAQAAAMGLPRDLHGACKALDLPVQKGDNSPMKRFCQPTKSGRWHEDPADFILLREYCRQDVEAEYCLSQSIPELRASEQHLWRVDQRMNDLGIYVDIESVEKIIEQLDVYETRLLAEVEELTAGKLRSTRQVKATRDWLRGEDIDLPDLSKRTVKQALTSVEPEHCRRILEIRQALGKSSTAKYRGMLDYACRDRRVRGTHLYHGAGTGRWSGKLLQPQNFPRGTLNDDDFPLASERGLFALVHDTLEGVEKLFPKTSPMEVASSCLRNVLTAGPGRKLYIGDLSQIEARKLALLAGEQHVLDAFAAGLDLYKVAAGPIFNVRYEDVVKAQRQIGKTADLALGYQGGIGAFASMAILNGIDLAVMVDPVLSTATEDEVRLAELIAESYFKKNPDSELSREQALACDVVKQRWRSKRPMTVQFWSGLEDAAARAVQTGQPHAYGMIKFGVRGRFLHMRLPSGRLLSYCDPEIREVTTPWGEPKCVVTAMSVDSKTKKWRRRGYYGGLWAENATQAASRDILAEAMAALDADGFPIIMTVHDEVVCEVPEDDDRFEAFKAHLTTVPSWAKGLPLAADCGVGKRYRK